MFSLDSLFRIPDDVAARVPCQGAQKALYMAPALDVDMDDDEWVSLDREEQFARLEAKQAAEQAAVAACHTCPLLQTCTTWAMDQGQEVFGVVAGLTQEQRPNHNGISHANYAQRGPLGQVRDDLIDQWSQAGIPNKTIAARLGCNIRTVERRKLGRSQGTIVPFEVAANANTDQLPDPAEVATVAKPASAAKGPLLVSRVTPETGALYDALIDGRFHDRNEVLDQVAPLIDTATALAAAPKGRQYPNQEAQVATGTRKFLLNRLDLAVRRGRIHTMTSPHGRVLICLDPEAAQSWRAAKTEQLIPA
jgi:hypothetical protein